MADSGCEDSVPTLSASTVPLLKMPEESDASMRARLYTSLSQSFPHSQLYRALHGGEDIILNGGDNTDDDDDSLYGDHLSNSCFASLRMDRRDSDDFDDDLRSLEWLQNEDLLKNIGGEKLDRDEEDGEEQKENDIKPDISLLQGVTLPPSSSLSYLPQKHVNSKPPYSFSCLIFMAVEASPQKRLPVKDIYNWILTQFPYFQNAPTGWKNSVRHNLSLNKCFKKVDKDKGQSIGKGSLWCIDPAYRPNLLQALRKTPYHPYHQLQMTSTQPQNYIQFQSLPGGGRTVLPLTQRPVPNTVSPHLFPFLSRRLAQTSFDVDNEMKDVAQTLVALKASCRKDVSESSSSEDTGPTWRYHKKTLLRRPPSPFTITDHPYEDHAYSSTSALDDDAPSPSSSSSIDEEYDFGDADEECDSNMDWGSEDQDEVDGHVPLAKADNKSRRGAAVGRPAVIQDNEEDEQKKLHEGASALLNLAGLLMNQHNSGSGGTSIQESPNKISSWSASVKKSPNKVKPENSQKEKTKRLKKSVHRKLTEVTEVKQECADEQQAVKKEEEDDNNVFQVEKRRRSVSKRKNAGNNAKYDTGEYSLGKLRKAASKKRASNAKSIEAEIKTTNCDTDQLLVSKKEPINSLDSPTKVRKRSVSRKKLKLSKKFMATNNNSLITDKNNSSTDAPKKFRPNSKGKKSMSRTKTSRHSSASFLKKRKVKLESRNEVPAATREVEPGPDSIQAVVGLEKVENHDTSKASSLGQDTEADETSNKALVLSGLGLMANPLAMVDQITSPAGDAPAHKRTPTREADNDTDRKCSTSRAASSSPDPKSTGSRNNANRPDDQGLHQSPHFTRFSKKKAGLS